MPLTITEIARTTYGTKRSVLARVAFDNSYPTGGEPLTAATLGLSTIDAVFCDTSRATTGGATARTVSYDITNAKLFCYTTASAEATNASDQSAFSVYLQVIGN